MLVSKGGKSSVELSFSAIDQQEVGKWVVLVQGAPETTRNNFMDAAKVVNSVDVANAIATITRLEWKPVDARYQFLRLREERPVTGESFSVLEGPVWDRFETLRAARGDRSARVRPAMPAASIRRGCELPFRMPFPCLPAASPLPSAAPAVPFLLPRTAGDAECRGDSPRGKCADCKVPNIA